MKRVCLLVVMLSAAGWAQARPATAAPSGAANPAARTAGPSPSDLYCAGFLSKDRYNHSNYVAGGLQTPDASLFGRGDTLFLEGGGYQEGQRYSVIRELIDINRYEPYRGQHSDIAGAGQPYADMGYVRVTAIRGDVAIADVELACAPITPGDMLVPFHERAPLAFRAPQPFERFPTGTPAVTGRVVMTKDFDTVVGKGQKVYLNIGADKGLKPGDYVRAMRSYDPNKMEYVDALSYKMPPSDDTQKNYVRMSGGNVARLPARAVGEMMILSVTPSSATAMITDSKEAINVGDEVDLEGAAAEAK